MSTLKLSQIVGRYVELTNWPRRRGLYLGLSPLRRERTPSFTVDDDSGTFHCFASGEQGDAATFLKRMNELGVEARHEA